MVETRCAAQKSLVPAAANNVSSRYLHSKVISEVQTEPALRLLASGGVEDGTWLDSSVADFVPSSVRYVSPRRLTRLFASGNSRETSAPFPAASAVLHSELVV